MQKASCTSSVGSFFICHLVLWPKSRTFASEMKKDYQNILMDLDGTLTDPFFGITRSVQYALGKFQIEVTDLKELIPFIGPPLMDSFQEFYHFTKEQARLACDYYTERFVSVGWCENEVFPEIETFLKEQKEKGRNLYIATTKPDVLAEKILDYFGLLQYFTFVGGDTMEHTRSAKPEIIRYIMEKNGIIDKNSTIMIGDRKFDVDGAKAVGIDSIGVLYGYGSREEMEESKPTYLGENIKDLSIILT